ncbi:MAG: phosphonate C-P lyase system protein PhnG [Deltaproteobacteria bacterium]|nr:phosphonate C-P lyase system protein PhnG [Candidatus Anaeroferrophillacea bacterium]
MELTRPEWIKLLARAGVADLEGVIDDIPVEVRYTFLKPPETGLLMAQGRTGGDGAPFNLGEVPVTRCVVAIEGSGTRGFACVLGRAPRKAELAAVIDALMQHPLHHNRLRDGFFDDCRRRLAAREQEARTAAAATRVDFFTMVRGD